MLTVEDFWDTEVSESVELYSGGDLETLGHFVVILGERYMSLLIHIMVLKCMFCAQLDKVFGL